MSEMKECALRLRNASMPLNTRIAVELWHIKEPDILHCVVAFQMMQMVMFHWMVALQIMQRYFSDTWRYRRPLVSVIKNGNVEKGHIYNVICPKGIVEITKEMSNSSHWISYNSNDFELKEEFHVCVLRIAIHFRFSIKPAFPCSV